MDLAGIHILDIEEHEIQVKIIHTYISVMDCSTLPIKQAT